MPHESLNLREKVGGKLSFNTFVGLLHKNCEPKFLKISTFFLQILEQTETNITYTKLTISKQIGKKMRK